MKKIILSILLLLVFVTGAYAWMSIIGMGGSATVTGSSGSSQNDPFFAEGSVILLQSTGATPTVYFGPGGVYVSHEN